MTIYQQTLPKHSTFGTTFKNKAKSGTSVILKVNMLKSISRRSVKCLVLTNSPKRLFMLINTVKLKST